MRRNLGGDGPVSAIDGALSLLGRGEPRLWLPALGGGFIASGAVLLSFYVEKVEGVTSLRPLLALGVVLSLMARALLLAPAARVAVKRSWPSLPVARGGGRAVDVVRTASVAHLGLFFHLLVLATAALVSPIAAALLLPLLALRGLGAPSWIARAALSDEGGVAVYVRALGDSTGRRMRGALIELLLLVGVAGLAVNLYLTMVILLVLTRSLLGLDLASVDAFLSLRNPIVGASIVALAFVLLEPLRVALSAFTYVDAQVRREGLDLAAAIEEAERASERKRGREDDRDHGLAALAILAVLATPASGRAQPEAPTSDGVAAETAPGDEAVREEVAEILRRPEFIEVDSDRGRDLDALMRQLLEWLFEQSREQNADLGSPFSIPMPPTWFFIAAGSLLLGVVVAYVLVTRGKKRVTKRAKAASEEPDADDPRERAPEAHLDDAALLAQAGRFRDALRSLYLATLVALDRRRLITFDPSHTNWHYLHQLPPDERRTDFSRFTRLFDHKWYGEERTTEEDYRECRALADRIVGASGEA